MNMIISSRMYRVPWMLIYTSDVCSQSVIELLSLRSAEGFAFVANSETKSVTADTAYNGNEAIG
jgi:hypothetical protein